jgi:hypothetical protein
MLKLTLDTSYDVRFGLIDGVLGGEQGDPGPGTEPKSPSERAVGTNGTDTTTGARAPSSGSAHESEGGVGRFDDLDGKARKRAYARLGTILDGLESQGHVRAWDAGRSKELTVTEEGENLLRAFRHKAQPVIGYQAAHGRAEVPGWLEQGFIESGR